MPTLTAARRYASMVLWLPAVFGVAVLVINVTTVHRFTVDDSYITLRYSRNVARGMGAVYNTTGARAEGYTSFLWMMLLASLERLHQNALLAAKALGVVSTLAVSAMVAVWAYTETRGPRARVLAAGAAVAGYAALPRTAIHAVSGMETALFTALLTATLFTASRLAQGREKWALPFSALGLAAALTRPEASLAVVVAFTVALLLVPGAMRRRAVVTFGVVFALPLVGYELWRLHYYGLPLPLPFYVKLASSGAVPGSEPVLGWLSSELRFGVPLLILFVSPPRHLRPAIAVVGTLVLFFFLPQHLMGYDSRYLAPLDPTVAVLFGVGVGRLLRYEGPLGLRVNDEPRVFRGGLFAAGVAFVAFVLPSTLSLTEARGALRDRLDYADGLAAAHERLGRDLAALHVQNPRLATSDAGAVPYLSGWWTLDLLGLNDAQIAVSGSHEPAWVLSRSPDILVLISTNPERFLPDDWNAFEGPIFYAAIAAGFVRVDLRRFASDYFLWVLARPGFEAAAPLARLSVSEGTETESVVAPHE